MQLSYCPKECTFFWSWFADIKMGLVSGGCQESEKEAGRAQPGTPDCPVALTELSSA